MVRDVSSDFAVCFKELLTEACQRLRKQKKELAYCAGVRPDYLSKLQSGERRPHDPSVVLRIAAGLRLDPLVTDRLLEAAGFPPLRSVDVQVTPEARKALAFRPNEPTPAPLTSLLIEAARLTEDQISTRLARLGVSYLEAAVLVRLRQSPHGRLAMPELRSALRLSRAAATFTVSQLQARGLVRRVSEGGWEPEIERGLFSTGNEQRDDHVAVSLTGMGMSIQEPISMVLEGVESVLGRSLGARSSSDLRRTVDAFMRLH